jgi:hypothetical protein
LGSGKRRPSSVQLRDQSGINPQAGGLVLIPLLAALLPSSSSSSFFTTALADIGRNSVM